MILRSSVRDYLNRLHASFPPPEKGRDYRAKLKSAPFCRDTTTEALLKLKPIRQEMFDRDEYLLGLNNGTAESWSGTIRPMQREDFKSTDRIPFALEGTQTCTRLLAFREISGIYASVNQERDSPVQVGVDSMHETPLNSMNLAFL